MNKVIIKGNKKRFVIHKPHWDDFEKLICSLKIYIKNVYE